MTKTSSGRKKTIAVTKQKKTKSPTTRTKNKAKAVSKTTTKKKKQQQQKTSSKTSSSRQAKNSSDMKTKKITTITSVLKKHQTTQPLHHIIFDNDGGKDDIVALALLIAGQVATELPTTAGVSLVQTQNQEKYKQGELKKNDNGNNLDSPWQRIQIDGITMLDGDCVLEPAADAMRRMLALGLNKFQKGKNVFGSNTVPTSEYDSNNFKAQQQQQGQNQNKNQSSREIPVVASPLQNVGSPFPLVWRRSSMTVDFLPVLNSPFVNQVLKTPKKPRTTRDDVEGHEALAQMVFDCSNSSSSSSEQQNDQRKNITLLATGPLSNLAYCINKYGLRFTSCIDRIIIMGGAIDVAGNVLKMHAGSHDANTANHVANNNKASNMEDRSAEWNIYWDAPAAKVVLQDAPKNLLKDKIYLFSLDSTNSVPITEEIVRDFGSLNSKFLMPNNNNNTDDGNSNQNIAPFAQIAGTCWAICPWYPKEKAPKYYAWDVLCAAYLLDPSVVSFEKRSVDVVTDGRGSHPQEGRLVSTSENNNNNDGNIFVAKDVDQNLFYRILRTALQL